MTPIRGASHAGTAKKNLFGGGCATSRPLCVYRDASATLLGTQRGPGLDSLPTPQLQARKTRADHAEKRANARPERYRTGTQTARTLDGPKQNG
ncbi:hypothetical protein MRX96_030229 [Rhipicephalus microplus]